jgi:hypothetical protein
MAKFLRKVQSKTDWDPAGEFSRYIPAGEAPADALNDLTTSDNCLSVWEIDDDGRNLERVLAAIVSSRDYLQKLDYLMVDRVHIVGLGLAMEKKFGETYDGHANGEWHFDLTRLSATDLSRLANTMFVHGTTERKNKPKLVQLLKKSIQDGYVNEADLRPQVRESLSG